MSASRKKDKYPPEGSEILWRLKNSLDGHWKYGKVNYVGRTMNNRYWIMLPAAYTTNDGILRLMVDEIEWEYEGQD